MHSNANAFTVPRRHFNIDMRIQMLNIQIHLHLLTSLIKKRLQHKVETSVIYVENNASITGFNHRLFCLEYRETVICRSCAKPNRLQKQNVRKKVCRHLLNELLIQFRKLYCSHARSFRLTPDFALFCDLAGSQIKYVICPI